MLALTPQDYVLDVWQRMLIHPFTYASEADHGLTHPKDYTKILFWLHKYAPELFSHPMVKQRVALYGMAYELGILKSYPMADWPIERLQKYLAGMDWHLYPCRKGFFMVLYRPVGEKELALVRESGYRCFPPRLPQQPIFYPVLNEEYAVQIARDWNTKDEHSGYKGYVTHFEVADSYLAQFDVHTVGAAIHKEYWIPAEELENFNRHIVGQICVIEEFG